MREMAQLPTGTLTFLFTDIEGSTVRWERHPEIMRAAVARHDALLRGILEAHGGIVFKTVGDAFYVVFSTAIHAIAAAVEVQQVLASEIWPADIGSLRVRIALNTGEAEQRGYDYFGQPLNRVARVLSSGHGGQILMLGATHGLVRDKLPAQVTLRDLGEHRLKDIQHPEHIFQLVIADLPADFPPLKTLDRHPNNLPTQLTSFVGRRQDLEAVGTLLLRNEVRLVTLIGPGGVGKTRLSLQVAANLAEAFPDGVYFVELDAIHDPEAVVMAIAQVMGMREMDSHLELAYLKDSIKGKVLLLLDNFEQVTGAAPLIHELLLACHHLKILVTSRALLHLGGEYEYYIAPFSLPEGKPPFHLANLLENDAVALFVEHAQSVKPDFRLTPANAATIVNICGQLDGLPLAIELAATRINLLPPLAMLKRLKSRFQLLKGNAHTKSARQQTLHSTIAWSYDLLNDDEKAVFSQLAIFVGGCTLTAIETVCGEAEEQGIDLLETLRSLLDKSLLRQQEQAGGEPRFLMLSTIREFALEQLIGQQRAALQERHAACYLELAEEADASLYGEEQKLWLIRQEVEHENMLAALEWYAAQGQSEKGLRLSSALCRFWWKRGYLCEGRQWLEKFLTTSDIASVPASVRARACEGAASLAWRQNDRERATQFAEQAIALAQPLGDEEIVSNANVTLAKVALLQGDSARANALFEDALKVRRKLGDKQGTAGLLANLGNMALQQGKFSRATMLFEESLALFREVRDEWAIAAVLNNLGEVERHRNNYERAAIFYEESLKLRQELGYSWGTAATMTNLGHIMLHQAHSDRAWSLYKEGLTLFHELGDDNSVLVCLAGLADVAFRKNQLDQAVRLFAQVEITSQSMAVTLHDRVSFDTTLAALRSALGPDRFETLWTTSKALLLNQVIDEILAA